jgi:predicted Rossmann-fold nucleotide-binding protein
VVIAVSGGYGTLSEIALALKVGKTVIGLETWKEIEGVQHVSTAAEAVERARAAF